MQTSRCYQDKGETKGEETEVMGANVAKRRKAMKIVKKVKEVTMMEITVTLERIRGDRRNKDEGEWATEKVMHASELTKLG